MSESLPDSLPDWRKRLQIPGLVFASLGIVVAGFVIYARLTAPSYAEVLRGQVKRARPAASAFDLTRLSIPRSEVHSGGPPKDGIPALNDPETVAADKAFFLLPSDPVIGVAIEGQLRAYPLEVMDYHEIVNDTIGRVPIAVTYCPLCDSAAVFDRRLGGRTVELGVSGLLYNSNVLMFDRAEEGKESLWSQMAARAVSGESLGESLRSLPQEVCSWESWRERFPETTVLSHDTGHLRKYDRSGYAPYFASSGLMFPVTPIDDRLTEKRKVLGVRVGEKSRAYAYTEGGTPEKRSEALGGFEFDLVVDPRSGAPRVENPPEELTVVYSYWFAWSAFYPETELVDLDPPAVGHLEPAVGRVVGEEVVD